MESGESQSAPKELFITKVTMSSKSEAAKDTVLSSSDSSSDSDSDHDFECKVCDKQFSGLKPFLQHELSGKHKKAVLKKKKIEALLEKIDAAEQLSEGDDDLLQMEDSYAACEVCKKEFAGPESYLAHLKSKVHKQKVRQAAVLEKVAEDGEINLDKLKKVVGKESESEESDEDVGQSHTLECRECEKSFSGLRNFAQHMFSKVHARTMQKKKLAANLLQKGGPESAGPTKHDVSSLAEEDSCLVCKLCTVTFSGPENALAHLKSRGHNKSLEKQAWRLQKRQARRSQEARSGNEAAAEEAATAKGEPSSGSDAESSGEGHEGSSTINARESTATTSTIEGSLSVRMQPSHGSEG